MGDTIEAKPTLKHQSPKQEQEQAKFVTTRKRALEIPTEVKSAREKILYALWTIGELAYHRIHFLTGLSKKELDSTLSELLRNETIIKTRSGFSLDDPEDNLSSGTYRIHT